MTSVTDYRGEAYPSQAPTYDDMLLLSSLLGPAKPPVAAQTDVDSAGGTFVLDQNSEFRPSEGERCLVCLCDYEDGNECRQLSKCKHLFHRECIDQVSVSPSLVSNTDFHSG